MEAEFEKLYLENFRALFVFIRSKVDNKETAEDLVAESFVKAFKNLKSFKGDASFKTWIFTIGRNLVIDWYRKRANLSMSQLVENSDITADAEDNLDTTSRLPDASQKALQLQQILLQLPERYAEVLRLRFLAEMSIKEAAQVLGESEGNVKVIQNRALKKAKQLISLNER